MYPRLYETVLSMHEPPAAREARLRMCPYARDSLRAAFAAGWWAYTRRVQLDDYTPPVLLSKLAAAAWLRGIEARKQYESDTSKEG